MNECLSVVVSIHYMCTKKLLEGIKNTCSITYQVITFTTTILDKSINSNTRVNKLDTANKL